MTDASIDEILDEYVPPFAPRSQGWEDVLGRARRSRRRYAALAAAALALVLVPTAVSFGGRVVNLFQGTPAPPAVTWMEEERDIPSFAVGDHVRHASFGEGRVLGVEGEGVRAVVTVQFAQGVKRLALGYAPLEHA